MSFVFIFFFFQAEDGIRDYKVTGVQTCALPILVPWQVKELIDRPGNMSAQVYADLRHRLLRERVDARRFGASARDLEAVTRHRAEEPLGHLTSGGVVRTDE